MKYRFLVVLWISLINLHALALPDRDAADKYIYTIDLTRVENDKVQVELSVPSMSASEINFYLPKIIPGTYKEADYGRFVTNFQAFDKKGRALEVVRQDDNTWKISKAKKLRKIIYEVNDTYDADMGANQVYPMAGTNIEDKKNFVLNTSGFFGYFEGMKDNEFELNFIRPSEFYGSTGLIPEATGIEYEYNLKKENIDADDESKLVDRFVTSDYNLLIDSPIMYNKPDTTLIDVGGTEVLVSVYSPNGLVTSKFIAENIDDILNAQRKYLGGTLPVDKYAFLFYCEDPSRLAPVQGALEHSYSSFYYFPEVPQENLRQAVKDVAAHEFFHIVTPLNIHSEEIQYFDFNNPQMSKHLWMYEGVTEYSAHHVQVKYALISDEQFLAKIQQKMQTASFGFNDTLSFTDLSKYTLDKYPDQYGNVYEKGALIGMLLDIQLLNLSDGEYGIQNLMRDLSKKYGKDKPFKDENLFNEIVELTYPQIEEFFDKYLVNGHVLPYQEVLRLVGIDYDFEKSINDYSFGNINLGFDPEARKLIVSGTDNMNEFGKKMGYKTGDLLLKINERDIPLQGLEQFIDAIKASMQEGDTFSVTVLRAGESGEKEEMILSSEIFKTARKEYHVMSINENATEQQLKIRQAWLRP
ncbi:MAG: peptidase M61 [Cytophagales bacterium]|nr:peptidase M61 [Cytophagales bacterium]